MSDLDLSLADFCAKHPGRTDVTELVKREHPELIEALGRKINGNTDGSESERDA